MNTGAKFKVAVLLSLVVGVCAHALCATDSNASDDTKEVPVNLDDLDKAQPDNSEKELEVNLDDLEDKPANTAQEEEAVDLDDLDGEKAESGEAPESYLPVNTDDIEPKTNSFFILSALGVLLPVAAMLFPPRRKKGSVAKKTRQNAD